MRDGVKARDMKQIFDHVSQDFHFRRHNRTEFRSSAENVLKEQRIEDVLAWDFEPVEISRTKKSARLNFKVKAKGAWRGSEVFYRCTADFVLDPDGQWRLSNFELFEPFVNTSQPVDIPGL
jgi:hypothetical protein